MRRDAFFGDVVHLLGSDLHLERLPAVADHGRVKRLVQVVARYRDPILETLGNGRPDVVDYAQRQIAVLSVVRRDDAGGDQVVNLLDHDLLLFEFFPERIETLDPALDLDERDLVFGQSVSTIVA